MTKLPPHIRTAFRVGIGMLAILLLFRNVFLLTDTIMHADLTASDFSSFYAAGKLIRTGQSSHLYDLQAQAAMHLNPKFRILPLPYAHAPFEALLYAPLTWLPFLWAYAIWNLTNLGLLAWICWRLGPWLKMLSPGLAMLLMIPALLYWPNIMTLLQGQDSILLGALFTETFVQLKLRRDGRAGIFLALALFKFHLAFALLACLLCCRRWRLLWGFAATAAGLAGVSFLMIGTQGVHQYLDLLAAQNRPPLTIYVNPYPMPNLRGLVINLISSSQDQATIVTLLFSMILFLAMLVAAQDRERGERFNLYFAAATGTSYLIGYHGYVHDMAMVFPGLLLAVAALRQPCSARWKLACGFAIGMLFLSELYYRLYLHSALALMSLPLLMLTVLLIYAPAQADLQPVLPNERGSLCASLPVKPNERPT